MGDTEKSTKGQIITERLVKMEWKTSGISPLIISLLAELDMSLELVSFIYFVVMEFSRNFLFFLIFSVVIYLKYFLLF